MSTFPRSAGVLLHPTSLPGRYGVGDLGDWAYRFVDWLLSQGLSAWQLLPLGPTGYADSPYQTLSAFAGNPVLISFDRLLEQGWLRDDDLAEVPAFPVDHCDFGWANPYHDQVLRRAYERFEAGASAEDKAAVEAWCKAEAAWLDDYALFAALKASFDLRPWVEWPRELVTREKKALTKARKDHAEAITQQKFRQWLFFSQWEALRRYANERGVRLIGDIPIFVAHDSADVWAHQDEYFLDSDGQPTVIAGVPPDYFSPTGQRWGNPLYRWDVHRARGYTWWLDRIRASLRLVDALRIDHFRGFDAFWEIPASEETAVKGEWKPGPGADLFEVIRRELGELPIIAEDLGLITKTVEELRVAFELPGMKVLQFAWSQPDNVFLPHNIDSNSVVYTGTHDNNTTRGWWEQEADEGTRRFMAEYLGNEVKDVITTLMRIGMSSPAHTFVLPMQDVLGLGREARMNTPGEPSGHWQWRFQPEQMEQVHGQLAHFTWLYGRRPEQRERVYGDSAVKAQD